MENSQTSSLRHSIINFFDLMDKDHVFLDAESQCVKNSSEKSKHFIDENMDNNRCYLCNQELHVQTNNQFQNIKIDKDDQMLVE